MEILLWGRYIQRLVVTTLGRILTQRAVMRRYYGFLRQMVVIVAVMMLIPIQAKLLAGEQPQQNRF